MPDNDGHSRHGGTLNHRQVSGEVLSYYFRREFLLINTRGARELPFEYTLLRRAGYDGSDREKGPNAKGDSSCRRPLYERTNVENTR